MGPQTLKTLLYVGICNTVEKNVRREKGINFIHQKCIFEHIQFTNRSQSFVTDADFKYVSLFFSCFNEKFHR